ncbi:DUF2397 domain-containing protein [Halobacillus yeomjeoni]|uniref:DUF2397 family protein n=1 Tax=Halobacillus yeomjeoni TaxID=311194 RepID=UPI001CD6357D|nr:DUF2397 family protein [Halobacillus yeomjeoni]MCA0984266.1 DUF2397 domain-containing protein [Halobacillus yeomjeoni]
MNGIRKPLLQETLYLCTDQWVYRVIIHYCYKRYKGSDGYVTPEELLEYLQGTDEFENYSLEEVVHDLKALELLGNLVSTSEQHETEKSEEKSEVRYKVSEVTVGFQKVIEQLESTKMEKHAI